MPNKWVPAEVFVSHEGVTIYYTYYDETMEEGRRDDRYGYDEYCHADINTFDIADLPNPDRHDVDSEDGRKAIIREAIDIGILTQDGVASYRAEISVCGTCGKEFTEGEFDEKDLIGLAFSDDGSMSFVRYNNLRVANSGGVNLCRKCVNQIAENRDQTRDGVGRSGEAELPAQSSGDAVRRMRAVKVRRGHGVTPIHADHFEDLIRAILDPVVMPLGYTWDRDTDGLLKFHAGDGHRFLDRVRDCRPSDVLGGLDETVCEIAATCLDDLKAVEPGWRGFIDDTGRLEVWLDGQSF